MVSLPILYLIIHLNKNGLYRKETTFTIFVFKLACKERDNAVLCLSVCLSSCFLSNIVSSSVLQNWYHLVSFLLV